ncbi:MAG: hypothetical protein ACLFRF_04995, partial [Desulfobacterales bacterium]
KNNILWNNAPNPLAASAATGPAELIMTYSDVQTGTGEDWLGAGCITADPLFADPENGDFSLSWENYPIADATQSPCINAGDPASPPDPDGSRADIGALPYGVSLGDVNGDYTVTLEDAILALQNCVSLEGSNDLNPSADVDGDNKIGLPEAIFNLRYIGHSQHQIDHSSSE